MKNLILGIIFLGVGVGVSYWGYGMLQEAKASGNWPSVTGKIITSDVNSRRSTSGSGSKKKTSTVYEPVITYRYKVDGKSYTSSRITAGDYSSSSSKRAYRIAGKYPEGSDATIYYNPEEPYLSVLEPGATFMSYLPFAMGLLFGFVGVMALLGGIFRIIKRIFMFAAG